MAWGVELNRPHLRLWGRLAVGWALFVGFGLVAGAHLKPRADEITFMLALPLAVVIPYVLVSFVGVTIRSLWLAPRGLIGFRRLGTNKRLAQQAGS